MLASQFHGVCLCTVGEDEVEEGGERGKGEGEGCGLSRRDATARAAVFYSEMLRSAVRSLRTTDLPNARLPVS